MRLDTAEIVNILVERSSIAEKKTNAKYLTFCNRLYIIADYYHSSAWNSKQFSFPEKGFTENLWIEIFRAISNDSQVQ